MSTEEAADLAPAPGGPAADQPVRARKLRDGSLFLPFAGLIAFMPPVAQIFAVEGTILSVPIVVVYVFAVWLLLIVAAARLARRLEA